MQFQITIEFSMKRIETNVFVKYYLRQEYLYTKVERT